MAQEAVRFRPTVSIIIGIAVAAGVLLVLTGVAIVICAIRIRDRQSSARINAEGARRLNRYRKSNYSINSADVARMPGSRPMHTTLTSPTHSDHQIYTSMASREMRERPHANSDMRYTSRALRKSQTSSHERTSSQAWPIPPRLKRSAKSSPLHLQPPLSAVDERPTKDLKMSAATQNNPSVRLVPNGDHKIEILGAETTAKKFDDMDLSKAALTPKPLFHGQSHRQSRSASHGQINLSEGHKQATGGSPGSKSLDVRRLPRSMSLCGQSSGLAPSGPLPPLPPAIASARFSKFKIDLRTGSNRESGSTLILSDTSAVCGSTPRPFSQAETDNTSLSVLSPPIGKLSAREAQVSSPKSPEWHAKDIEELSQNDGAARTLTCRPPLNSRSSERASVHGSVPRSPSTGVSPSLLDHNWSRSGSNTSLGKSICDGPTFSIINAGDNAEKTKAARRKTPSSPLKHDSTFDIHEDARSMRKSVSCLQAISGAEGYPVADSLAKRPLSFPTFNEFQCDELDSAAVKTRGHRRQNCVRISGIQIIPPLETSPKPPAIQEHEEVHHETSDFNGQILRANPKRQNYQPPSRLTFDPQIKSLFGPQPLPTSGSGHSSRSDQDGPKSPTLWMYNWHCGSEESPPVSPFETPTRKPRDANRKKQSLGFNGGVTSWPLAQIHNPPASSMQEGDPVKNITDTSLDDFPRPPRSRPSENLWRAPKTPIRGPRAPPSTFHTPSQRHSPVRGIGKTQNRYSPSPGRRGIIDSVRNMRRMNSTNSDRSGTGGGKGHARYVSLGGRESSIFDDDTGDEKSTVGGGRDSFFKDELEEDSRPREIRKLLRKSLQGAPGMFDFGTGVVLGPREMPSVEHEVKFTTPGKQEGRETSILNTPSEFYDASGFLKV